ncbi:hypothetical protein LNN35_21280 [Pseudomonas stutzeri]|jgi:hypothetical protein|uniref:hypothetical protein n=1 Tax=Stutzerimonas stutzeri group TaxID=136846 RepID=UPI001AAE4815|nr:MULTISPECIES: hypothetical protein [Stutzerimonas stutzeri group]MCC8345298.1 hypothetical protein [Stutzerimonas stutzeri]QTF59198.1 hypothetical protein J4H94_21230 [Stutzerimonas frequens]HCF1642815.1 hypothetical protein [Pseudomonas aeruginosa]
MTEATNIWTATANEITKAVRESLIAMGCGEPQTGDVYDQLLLIGRSGVEELVPSVSKFGAREFESVMAVVVDLLGGDGIAVHGELPIWLRVYPSVEGKLPAFSVDDWRWIRLSSIQEVQPRRAIAIGEDTSKWQLMVNVVANGLNILKIEVSNDSFVLLGCGCGHIDGTQYCHTSRWSRVRGRANW